MGSQKKVENDELEALLGEDCCQTVEELTESLEDIPVASSKCLKAAGYQRSQ